VSTVLEALAVVHAEQGYLILNSCRQYKNGDVSRTGEVCMPGKGSGGGMVREKVYQPVTIVGVATREEFLRQNDRLDQLMQVKTPWDFSGWPYFYRVVATD